VPPRGQTVTSAKRVAPYPQIAINWVLEKNQSRLRERSYIWNHTTIWICGKESRSKMVLDAKLTIQEIARSLGRPPITIKREIFRNRVRQTIQEVQYCRITRNDCTKRITCTRTNLCAYCVNKEAKLFLLWARCNEVCEAFVQTGCDRRDRTHGCCNACSNSRSCKLRRWYYRPKEAQKLARHKTRRVQNRIDVDTGRTAPTQWDRLRGIKEGDNRFMPSSRRIAMKSSVRRERSTSSSLQDALTRKYSTCPLS